MIQPNGLTTNSIWTATVGDNTLWTPSTGKRCRMTRLYLYVTANAALGNQGGILTLTLKAGVDSTNLTWKIYLPPATLISNLPGGMQVWNTNFQIGTVGTPAITTDINEALILNLDKALTAGFVGAQVMGWEDQ